MKINVSLESTWLTDRHMHDNQSTIFVVFKNQIHVAIAIVDFYFNVQNLPRFKLFPSFLLLFVDRGNYIINMPI